MIAHSVKGFIGIYCFYFSASSRATFASLYCAQCEKPIMQYYFFSLQHSNLDYICVFSNTARRTRSDGLMGWWQTSGVHVSCTWLQCGKFKYAQTNKIWELWCKKIFSVNNDVTFCSLHKAIISHRLVGVKIDFQHFMVLSWCLFLLLLVSKFFLMC